MDNLFTGSKDNIRHLLTHDHFEFIRHDIVEPVFLEVDQIYNLACPASPIHYQYNPVKTIKTSVMGTINMLGLAKRVKARILQASTSEIYGNPEIHPQVESYWGNVNTIGIRSCYDEGKRCAETLFFDYHRQNNVDIRVARIFNTYGPRMDKNDGRVISNFIVQALKGEDITIYGDGSHTRSFCYIDDMVNGLIDLMDNSKTGPINLGNPNESSIRKIAEQIKDMCKSTSKITYLNLPDDDPVQRKPDIQLAENTLNWNPKITLEKGLQKTITYFKSIL